MTRPSPPPVLLTVFNRPGATRRVFARIRAARPERLFVAADGPRPHRPEEARRCAAVRRIATAVDWPCRLHTRFLDHCHGCRRAVAGAIDWFFAHVEAGIVLEDDCLPSSAFFAYCAELLERYADERRIMLVGGFHPHQGRRYGTGAYYFSRYPLIWGWATWRRAWQAYDDDPARFHRTVDRSWFRRRFHRDAHYRYFRDRFERTFTGRIDSWGYIWFYAICRAGGLAIHPNDGLVRNIGFTPEASHTRKPRPAMAETHAGSAPSFPLRHPARIAADARADADLFRRMHCPSPWLFHLAQAYRGLRKSLGVDRIRDRSS